MLIIAKNRPGTIAHSQILGSSMAGAIFRTSIDVLLSERMSRQQSELSLKGLCMKAEMPDRARAAGQEKNVSGDVDYVMGYDCSEGLGSLLVVVEAKKDLNFASGVAFTAFMCISPLPSPVRLARI